jgi:hypothetical protein
MKRILFIAAISLPLIWTACSGDKPGEAEDIVPKGMKGLALDDKALHLDSTGFPVKINVPDSDFYPNIYATATANGMEVKVGPHFDILVNMGGAEESNLAKQKELIKATDIGESTFLVDDTTSLLWQVKFGDLSVYHFYHIVRIGNEIYYVRDNIDNPENQFKKEEVEKMMESAKSLRSKPSVPKA